MKKFSKKNPITLIKLGGSVITNKASSMSLKRQAIEDLVEQVKKIREEFPKEQIIVSHGQGSFAHIPAHKYKTMDGFINEGSLYGMAVVQDVAARLNREIVKEFLNQGIPAVSFLMSNSLITNNKKAEENFFVLLEKYLEKGLFPITCGDVIIDKKMGCTIWSTEKILNFFVEQFTNKGYFVKRVIHITEVDGFLNDKKEVIKKISSESWKDYQKHLRKTRGIDVTGGMDLKIEESLKLVKKFNITSYIMSGKNNNLFNFFAKKEWIGTEIS
jgi:isopentenyl phosphate kinase